MIGLVRPTERSQGILRLGREAWRCALGRGGVRADKSESDGATPTGPLPLRRILYRADRLPPPACFVPVEPIGPQDGWCDDPSHPDYNRPVALPHPARHEELWRQDGVYDVIGVLGWNDAPVVRHRGSAIFLHVARPGYGPTEGCVALALPDLLAALSAGLTGLQVEG
ncbi:L,D-transpeptidase family protein [Roseomonas sp. OT10]|uniref:L,D-transpeptidase family protein n=1 Tax=Roseomonas cutis TaxID=2897332 RepID=UPI001E3CFD92|nr:L,D-transpeptidase family protein [Roseomonas sp. OT10]UFN47948.1 L,D-transpeptidase family protein [Roseomonas sp. OT10]